MRPDGSEIYQTLRLNIVPFGRHGALRSHQQADEGRSLRRAGASTLFYCKYEEFGDFIDFFDPDLPVYNDAFYSSGVAFGFHAIGGVRFYLNRDFAIVAEGRYQWAEDDMGGDFSPNEPGPGQPHRPERRRASTVGVHVRF